MQICINLLTQSVICMLCVLCIYRHQCNHSSVSVVNMVQKRFWFFLGTSEIS